MFVCVFRSILGPLLDLINANDIGRSSYFYILLTIQRYKYKLIVTSIRSTLAAIKQ